MTREEAIEEIQRMIDWAKAINSAVPDLIEIVGAESALEILEQPERKNGKWEVADEAPPRRYGCSVCKKLSWDSYAFCPHCGAKMEE